MTEVRDRVDPNLAYTSISSMIRTLEMLDKVYGGPPIKLLAHLVDQHRPSEKELGRMRELLKRAPKR